MTCLQKETNCLLLIFTKIRGTACPGGVLKIMQGIRGGLATLSATLERRMRLSYGHSLYIPYFILLDHYEWSIASRVIE